MDKQSVKSLRWKHRLDGNYSTFYKKRIWITAISGEYNPTLISYPVKYKNVLNLSILKTMRLYLQNNSAHEFVKLYLKIITKAKK